VAVAALRCRLLGRGRSRNISGTQQIGPGHGTAKEIQQCGEQENGPSGTGLHGPNLRPVPAGRQPAGPEPRTRARCRGRHAGLDSRPCENGGHRCP
jgi:hypothetical protein